MVTKQTSRSKKATPRPRRRTRRREGDEDFNLGQQIAELRGIVVQGFKGVHNRQDITNGRIAKVEGRVSILETDNATSRGRSQGAWRLWLILSAIAGIIIGLLTIVAISGCWGLVCH